MFPDFPFDPSLSSFLPHHEVQRYLESYCQTHRIRPHVRVSHMTVTSQRRGAAQGRGRT